MIINEINAKSTEYNQKVNKKTRKLIGQFFTPPSIARYMASLMESRSSTVKILDPGAGTGILTGALCERILESDTIQNIHVDLYENDIQIIPVLKENMLFIQQKIEEAEKHFSYSIIQENFILDNADFWNGEKEQSSEELYDVIISNPPYKKIAKSTPESIAMASVVHGQPNIYFLFMAMAGKLLKPKGEMIFITPRSFTSGAYFQKFRRYFFNTVRLTNIHLFHSRNDVFEGDQVLQESIILRAVKGQEEKETIHVSSSDTFSWNAENSFDHHVSYETVVNMNSDKLFMLIPTSEKEVELLNVMNSWETNLLELGYKLKTGPVVDFRETEFLKWESQEDTVPLLWANHFVKNRISFPVLVSKNPQYLLYNQQSLRLLLENKNYLLIKRFTSKEEKRRVQCSMYFAADFLYEKIGIENHLNYVAKAEGIMSNEEMYGLFALFNSSIIDTYYRILNGSTQVNANEFNAIPLPSLEEIRTIGKRLIANNDTSTETCDLLIADLFKKDEVNEGEVVS